FMWCNRPHSHGSVTLASPSPDDYPRVDLNLLDDPRDMARLMDGVRRLAALVVCPALNPNPDDLFPAAFTPRIKRLSAVAPGNATLNAILGAMLDVPAGLRRRILRTFMTQGASLADILANDGLLERFVRRNV